MQDSPLLADINARPWFESNTFEKQLAEKNLDAETEQLVRDYREQGYVVIDPEASSDDIDALPGEIAHRFAYHTGPYFSDETRLQDGWVVNERVKRLATSQKVMKVLELLYERKPIPFQTINFCKGSEQGTHSDTIHFHSIPPGFMCGVWLALEDIDEGNGPLHYYPRSHTLPIYNLADLGILASSQSQQYENYHLYEEFVAELMRSSGLRRHTISARKGEALIWSANLFHGGDPIREKGRSRWSQVTHFYFDNCLYYTPLLSDPHLGRWALRTIHDVGTGKPVDDARQRFSQFLAIDLPDTGSRPTGLRRRISSLRSRWDQLIEKALGS